MSEELGMYGGENLVVVRAPEVILAEAKKAAIALKDIVSKKTSPVIINKEQYLEFEDWMTVGKFFGLTVKVLSTGLIQVGDVQGYEARAAVLNRDGQEISAAESMCLNDETNWKGRPLFMLRSMAQTRACAKSLRNVLAWVVVLAGYKPTPAEEMQGLDNKKPPIQEPQKKTNGEQKEGKKTIKVISPIIDVSVKKDSSTTPPKWILYKITDGSGYVYRTFDTKFGELAVKEQGSQIQFEIEYQIKEFIVKGEKKEGKEIVSLCVAEPDKT